MVLGGHVDVLGDGWPAGRRGADLHATDADSQGSFERRPADALIVDGYLGARGDGRDGQLPDT